MADQIRRLTSEISLLIFISLSFAIFKLTFEKNVGTELISTYTGFLFIAWGVFSAYKLGLFDSQVKQISGNSAQSLLYAGGAIGLFAIAYSGVNFVFRQSVLPFTATEAQLSQTVFQSIFGGMVQQAGIDFSQL